MLRSPQVLCYHEWTPVSINIASRRKKKHGKIKKLWSGDSPFPPYLLKEATCPPCCATSFINRTGHSFLQRYAVFHCWMCGESNQPPVTQQTSANYVLWYVKVVVERCDVYIYTVNNSIPCSGYIQSKLEIPLWCQSQCSTRSAEPRSRPRHATFLAGLEPNVMKWHWRSW